MEMLVYSEKLIVSVDDYFLNHVVHLKVMSLLELLSSSLLVEVFIQRNGPFLNPVDLAHWLALLENAVVCWKLNPFEVGGNAKNVLFEELRPEKLFEEIKTIVFELQTTSRPKRLIVLCCKGKKEASFRAKRSSQSGQVLNQGEFSEALSLLQDTHYFVFELLSLEKKPVLKHGFVEVLGLVAGQFLSLFFFDQNEDLSLHDQIDLLFLLALLENNVLGVYPFELEFGNQLENVSLELFLNELFKETEPLAVFEETGEVARVSSRLGEDFN